MTQSIRTVTVTAVSLFLLLTSKHNPKYTIGTQKYLLVFIDVSLIYNIVLISGVKYNDSIFVYIAE